MNVFFITNKIKSQAIKKETITIRPTTESLVLRIDSVLKTRKPNNSSDSTTKESWRNFVNYFRLDFFTTLNAFYYMNPRDLNIDRSNLYGYYNLNVTNQFKSKFFSINMNLFNELGYRKYFDSIGVKNEDIYYCKIDINKTVQKKLQFCISYQAKSQLWKSWEYRLDSQKMMQKILLTSYFSPGYVSYSGGLSYRFWNSCSFELGLVGGQITKIRNSKIFETRGEDLLYGVEKNKQKRSEFGFSAQLQIPAKNLGKLFYWENNTRIFVNGKEMKDISNFNVDFSNGVHFIFLKYLRLGLRTKINYDKTLAEKPFISNMLIFGFYLSNKT